jgi:protein-S-isoprenylcysteine O-methyltransferase Ste14
LAALLLGDAGIRLYYQIGRRDFKRAMIKHELRGKFLNYPVSLDLIPMFFYILTPWIDRFRLSLPPELRKLGAGLTFADDILFIWSHKALGKNWSSILEIRKGHILVTDGP